MSESEGLIYACRLDGEGGGEAIGWNEIRSWSPESGGPIWVHLDYSAPSVESWLLEESGLDPVVAEALLSYTFDFEGKEARWLRFGFPWNYQSDLLDALEALAACGCAADPRFRALADHVRDRQGDDGRWLKEGGWI